MPEFCDTFARFPDKAKFASCSAYRHKKIRPTRVFLLSMSDRNASISSIASAGESDNADFFDMLAEGFAALREHQYAPSDAQIHLESTPEFLKHVIVNFIDPTASSGSLQFGGSPASASNPKASLELYEKLTFVLRTEYNSTLKRVPYTNFRSGANGIIDSLKLKTYMTGSQGGLISISEDSDIPWAKTGSVTGQGPDPSEWHKGPYCHVYLAAVDNLEHYRTKVKPSIQAFLSQIDAVARYNVGGKDAVEVTNSQYVIIFVPSGDNKNAEDGPRSGPGGKLGIWASARQRMAAREGNKDERDTPGSGSKETDTVDMEEFTASGHNSLTSYLSRVDKEIMRRLSNDFSAGIVCQLSTLFDVSEDELDVELKKLEWAAFLKGLGTAITNGFRERCRKYDDELRKLDQLRGADQQANPVQDRFDYSTFFLVKESLAFTYQQLNIPGEASLQYDELRAIIPEMRATAKVRAGGALFAFSANGESTSPLLSIGSVSGDPNAFRKRLRSVKDLQPLAHIIQQYIFARQTELSFKVKKPTEVVERCLSFVRAMYNFRRDLIAASTDKSALVPIESWAFNFCWDVKRACEKFYADDTESMSILETDGPKVSSQADRALACRLCELLAFARSRFLELGDIKLSENPIRSQINVLTQGLPETWKTWTPLTPKSALDEEDDDGDEGDESESFKPASASPSGNLLQDSLGSSDSYLSGYLELLKVIEATNRSAERHRSSARIAVEMAGVHVFRNDPLRATFALKAASTVYAKDRWELTRFLILLRLASFQRTISSADDYLGTLVQCFSPTMSKSAPLRALRVLQADFEAVLRSSLVSRRRIPMMTAFDPIIGLDGLKSTVRNLTNRDILKKVYVVGEMATVMVSLHSSLPNEITVEEISVDIVPFRSYVSTIEESKSGEVALDFDGDGLKVLKIAGPLTVNPGKNDFSLGWYPREKGQFVLASVSIKWHNIQFSYTSKELKRPTVRVDVLPASPTQSISCSPEYLLPGQQQPVTITFSAGSDNVHRGLAKLSCTGGLVMLPPGDDIEMGAWVESCQSDFGPSLPGDKVELNIFVKSNPEQNKASEAVEEALRVTVATEYQAPFPEDETKIEGYDDTTSFENHDMECQIPTLEKHALTVESQGISFFEATKATAHATVQCNSPSPVIIKSWKLTLPDFLVLSQDGDLNASLSGSLLEPHERATFAFSCEVIDESSDSQALLNVEFEDMQHNSYTEEFRLKYSRSTSAMTSPLQCPISVKVTPLSSKGNTLAPVTISYEVDTTTFVALSGNFKFQFQADPAAWILSGQSDGLVKPGDAASFKAEIVALPTRPGTIKSYPELLLFHLDDAGEKMPLKTDVTCCGDAFESISAGKHTTVAVPLAVKQGRLTI